jgi:hypothetical protein
VLFCDSNGCFISFGQSLIVNGNILLDFDFVVPRHGSAVGE